MTLSVHKFYDSAAAKKAVEDFNPEVNVELFRQSGLFSYWSGLLAQAERQHDRLLNAIDRMEAVLDKNIRDEAIATGTKITEVQVKARIAMHPKMVEARELCADAKLEVGLLKGTVNALRQRHDALMQISRNLISETRDTTVAGHIREDRNERVSDLLGKVKANDDMETPYEE